MRTNSDVEVHESITWSTAGGLVSKWGRVITYPQLGRHLRRVRVEAGMADAYGGHSFRIGGAQALAAAGKSVMYIMSYGRWTCMKSVLRYVTVPDFLRALDAKDMQTAPVDASWDTLQQRVDTHYDDQPIHEQLQAAPRMLITVQRE